MQLTRTAAGFEILSDSGSRYQITKVGTRLVCNCTGFKFRQHCQHVEFVAAQVKSRKKSEDLIEEAATDGRTDERFPYVKHYLESMSRTLKFVRAPIADLLKSKPKSGSKSTPAKKTSKTSAKTVSKKAVKTKRGKK